MQERGGLKVHRLLSRKENIFWKTSIFSLKQPHGLEIADAIPAKKSWIFLYNKTTIRQPSCIVVSQFPQILIYLIINCFTLRKTYLSAKKDDKYCGLACNVNTTILDHFFYNFIQKKNIEIKRKKFDLYLFLE
mgnify:CR=1 FL=1